MRALVPIFGVAAVAAGVTAAGLLVAPAPVATAKPAPAVPTTAVPATGSPAAAGTAPQAVRQAPPPTGANAVPAEPPANRPPGAGSTRPPGAESTPAATAGPIAATRVATRGSGRLMASTLTGDVVVPRKGDPGGVGIAALRVEPAKICLEATVTGAERITSMRLHRGVRGAAGPAVAAFPVVGPARAAGCVRVAKALTDRILENPENWHLLAGTARFPGTALRGQLMW